MTKIYTYEEAKRVSFCGFYSNGHGKFCWVRIGLKTYKISHPFKNCNLKYYNKKIMENISNEPIIEVYGV